MSVISEVLSQTAKVLELSSTFAEQEGLTSISNILKSTAYFTEGGATFADEHPTEALAAFLAGVAVTTVLFPEELVAGTTALAESAPMKAIANAIGGDVGTSAVNLVSQILVNSIASESTDQGVKYLLQTANSLLSAVSPDSGTIPVSFQYTNNTSSGMSQVSAIFSDGSNVSAYYSGLNGTGALTAQDVENANKTSQLTTYNPDGSTTTASFNGPNETGTEVSVDQENANGTSSLTTFNPNGSSVTDYYSGPNETGNLISQDTENPDGTSTIITFGPNGLTTIINYSGKHGTGNATIAQEFSSGELTTIVLSGIGLTYEGMSAGTASGSILVNDQTDTVISINVATSSASGAGNNWNGKSYDSTGGSGQSFSSIGVGPIGLQGVSYIPSEGGYAQLNVEIGIVQLLQNATLSAAGRGNEYVSGNSRYFTSGTITVSVGSSNNGTVPSAFTFSAPETTLTINDPSTFSGSISGFAPGDTIDIASIGSATSAELGTGNILSLSGVIAGTILLQLDPNQSYAGEKFSVAPDGNGGTFITIETVAVAPKITGTTASQTTNSEESVQPFSGVTIADANTGATNTLTITLGGNGGTLVGHGLSGGTNGIYTLTGTAGSVTSELKALFFAATAGAPGTTSTTSFTLSDTSSAFATATVDTTTTVIDTDPSIAPTITGTVSGQTTTSEAPVQPFSGVTITDVNAGATDTLTITVGGSGGALTGTGLSGSGGTYSLTGTVAQITTALDALTFTPLNGVANSLATTTFTLTDQSSAFSSAAVDNITTVTDIDLSLLSVTHTNNLQGTIHANNLMYSGTVQAAYASNDYIDGLNYIASFSDLIQAFGDNGAAGQQHFISYGIAEGRVSTFDGLDYIAGYTDLISAFSGAGSESAVQDAGATHYIDHGVNEGRTITFNGLDYIASYQDLIRAFGADNDAGAYHYIEHGAQEGRATTFDGLDYIASYSDLIKALGANEQAGTVHYINYGVNEGRSTTFNGLDYIASYSDLIRALGANNDAGAVHYIDHGYNEGRTTTFDGLDYIANYTDLMKAFGANEQGGAAHYINYGLNEGRSTTFNVAGYISAHTDLVGQYTTTDQFLTAYINTYVTTGHLLI